jgi:hypothetical protein
MHVKGSTTIQKTENWGKNFANKSVTWVGRVNDVLDKNRQKPSKNGLFAEIVSFYPGNNAESYKYGPYTKSYKEVKILLYPKNSGVRKKIKRLDRATYIQYEGILPKEEPNMNTNLYGFELHEGELLEVLDMKFDCFKEDPDDWVSEWD